MTGFHVHCKRRAEKFERLQTSKDYLNYRKVRGTKRSGRETLSTWMLWESIVYGQEWCESNTTVFTN